MAELINISSRHRGAGGALPVAAITLDDRAESNGWLLCVSDLDDEIVIDEIIMIGCGEFVDEVLPANRWTGYRYLFLENVLELRA